MRTRGLGPVLLACGCLDTNPLFVDPTEAPGDVTGEVAGATLEPTSAPGPTGDTTTTDSATTLIDETATDPNTVDPTHVSDTHFPANCGDGMPDADEECDDGNLVDTDDCSNTCTLPVCGDGVVQGYEQCDDTNDDDTDKCTSLCQEARCGDAFVEAGVEDCDDGNGDDLDSCDGACNFAKKYIFATSMQYSGDLGGMPGADMKCTSHAVNSGLLPKQAIYLAWLSDSMTSPAQRMAKHLGPYVLPGFGEPVVALDWADLTDGALTGPIDRDEHGNSLLPTLDGGCSSNGVHTNTDEFGAAVSTDPMNTCSDWMSESGAVTWGSLGVTSKDWTNACFADQCYNAAPILCVQQ